MMRVKRRQVELTVICLVLFIAAIIVNLPIISMFGTSIKPKSEVLSNIGLFPKAISLDNYKLVFTRSMFGQNLVNSLFYSIAVTALCIIIASLSGYALSRFNNIVIKVFGLLLLGILIFPLVLIIVPLFSVFQGIGLVDTKTAIIINYLAFQLPFSIWMLKGYFDSIPFELEEYALIDGCTQVQTLIKIIFPLSLPGVATVGVFTFIRCWNEYMIASIFIKSNSLNTISVGLHHFQQEFSVDWGALSAASVLATIPAVVFILVAQKYLIRGMTEGSVKG
jgi:multiple sugar transport system permease protein